MQNVAEVFGVSVYTTYQLNGCGKKRAVAEKLMSRREIQFNLL